MTNRTATAATLAATLRASRPGDVVVVSGAVDVGNLAGVAVPGPGVVVKAAPGATLKGWPDAGFAGVTFRGFRILCSHAGKSELGLWASRGGWLAIEDCQFVGTAPDLEASGSGLVMMGCVKTRRCTFSRMYAGISIQGGQSHLVEDCQFRDLWQDAISGTMGAGTVIRRNYFTDFRGPTLHLDCIQIIRGNAPTDGLLIEGNVFERGAGSAAQGVFTDGATGVWTIRGNAFLGGPWQTIAIYGAKPGTVIEDNFLQGYDESVPGKQVMTPWIKVHNGEGRVVIRNNITTGMNNVNSPGLDIAGNTMIKNARPGDRSALVDWMKGRDVAPAAKTIPVATTGAPLATAAAAVALGAAVAHKQASRRGVLSLALSATASLFGRI